MIGWQQVTKTPNTRLDGNWKRRGVKHHVRNEAHERCVYCGVHENYIGGVNAFHKDHLRPKSMFPGLENSLSNIYYACPICNTFKSNAWPNEPASDHSLPAFSDPAIINYDALFSVNWSAGLVDGNYVESRYIQTTLHLNRPQLIMTRREHSLNKRIDQLNSRLPSLVVSLVSISSQRAHSLVITYLQANSELQEIVSAGKTIPRYEAEDTK